MTPGTRNFILALSGMAVITTGVLLYRRFNKKTADGSGDPVANPTPTYYSPTGMGGAITGASYFPLQVGSRNEKVRELQSILGVAADGIFGSQTLSALKSQFGYSLVNSQSELDKIRAAKAQKQINDQQTAASASAVALLNAKAAQIRETWNKNPGTALYASQNNIGAYAYIDKASNALVYDSSKNKEFTKGTWPRVLVTVYNTTAQGGLLLKTPDGSIYRVNPANWAVL